MPPLLRLLLIGPWILIIGHSVALCATALTSNGVTWTLSADHRNGVFLTGDPWVVGPVVVTSITNDLHDPSFSPRPGQNGSMINPAGGRGQGYDDALLGYSPELNAGRPNDRPVSADNPLLLQPGHTLVSAVSWLYRTADDREPGAPRFGGGQKAPRPALRSAGILTVLAEAPPEDSFRPAYSGTDKTVRFTRARLDYSRLPGLAPLSQAPSWESLATEMARPWLDHVSGWAGGHSHPSEHMPNYGRDMARIIGHCSLAVLTGPAKPGANPAKDQVIANLVQFGIDLTGIAGSGGYWPADGGHGMGRKWPILFAGAMLDDPHMLEVGRWKTRFQENEQTFVVSQAEVDITNGPDWKPDRRAPVRPYAPADIGTPEWGIRHVENPRADNAHWGALYRDINNATIPAFALAARLMGLKDAWNHEPFFDYCDRVMAGERAPHNRQSAFLEAMWTAYRPAAGK